MAKRATGRDLDGVLLLNKPLHLSSNQALQRVKRLFQAKKAGHTGSLDPLATGMLPICFGKATKLSDCFLSADKHYDFTATLGKTTATGDAEGAVLATYPVPALTPEHIEACLAGFRGEIQQIPPMYSALKVNGKPLYEYARAGQTVERAPRAVQIYQLSLISYTQDTLTLTVHCSKGTYVRTLAEDIGKALGCGAYVSALHRPTVGHFQATQMLDWPNLEVIADTQGLEGLDAQLLSLADLTKSWPKLTLSPVDAKHIQVGKRLALPDDIAPYYQLRLSNGQFIGIGERTEQGLKAKALLSF